MPTTQVQQQQHQQRHASGTPRTWPQLIVDLARAVLRHRCTRLFLAVYFTALLVFFVTACGGGDPDDDSVCPEPDVVAALLTLGYPVAPRCLPREAPPPNPCKHRPEVCK